MRIIRKRAISFAWHVRSIITCAAAIVTASSPFCAAASPAAPLASPMSAAPPGRVLAQVTSPYGETVTFRMGADGSVSVDGAFPVSVAANSSQANHRRYTTPLDVFRAVAPKLQPPLALLEANAAVVRAQQQKSPHEPGLIRDAQAPTASRIMRPMDATDNWFVSNYCQYPSADQFCDLNGYQWAYQFAQSVEYGYAAALPKALPLTLSAAGIGSWNVPVGTVRWVQRFQTFWEGEFWLTFTWDATVSNAYIFDFVSRVDP